MKTKTISFSEKNKGWTSFWSFEPGLMCKLNNRFFAIKNGQLYLHNDKNNPIRNNFFGEQFSSKVKTIINDSPESDKIFKTLIIEGNKTWNINLKTNYTISSLTRQDFNQRESRYFAYLRKNEDKSDLHGHSAQGIGVVGSVEENTISFNSNISETINIGDKLYQANSNNDLLGSITAINNNIITVNDLLSAPVLNSFCYAKKESRIEGGEMRGYYLELELENNDTNFTELFAIECNVKKSSV
jgi:hypothetical protein